MGRNVQPNVSHCLLFLVGEKFDDGFLNSRTTYGVTIAGEWSAAINDCGLFVKGVETPSVFTGDCAQWSDSSAWTDGTKAGVMQLVMTNMDTFRDWFFWTWKVNSSRYLVGESRR
jgi:aryl-phospho-beta-D-glucosidase BglC (GH1 family)